MILNISQWERVGSEFSSTCEIIALGYPGLRSVMWTPLPRFLWPCNMARKDPQKQPKFSHILPQKWPQKQLGTFDSLRHPVWAEELGQPQLWPRSPQNSKIAKRWYEGKVRGTDLPADLLEPIGGAGAASIFAQGVPQTAQIDQIRTRLTKSGPNGSLVGMIVRNNWNGLKQRWHTQT